MKYKLLLISIAVMLSGCAPQPPPGKIHMVGGTLSADYYVDTGWFGGACFQAIRSGPYGSGDFLGVYIDDSININPPYKPDGSDPTAQRLCLAKAKEANYQLIVMGVAMNHPGWSAPAAYFARNGATYSALQWYPWCQDGNWAPIIPPARKAYIIQWNFYWSNCASRPPTPDQQKQLFDAVVNQPIPPEMILYY